MSVWDVMEDARTKHEVACMVVAAGACGPLARAPCSVLAGLMTCVQLNETAMSLPGERSTQS